MKFKNMEELNKALEDESTVAESTHLADSNITKSASDDFSRAEITGDGFERLDENTRKDLFSKTLGLSVLYKGDKQKAVAKAEELGDRLLVKSLNGLTGDAGGFFIEENVARGMLDLLRSETVVRKGGAQVITGNNYNYRYKTQGTTAEYTGECQDPAESLMTFGENTMDVKKLQARITICEDLIWNTQGMNWANIIADDFVEQIRRKEDISFIRGSGTGASVMGLLNRCLPSNKFFARSAKHLIGATNPIATITADVGKCIALLESRDVPANKRGWIMHPSVKTALQILLNDEGHPIWGDELSRNMWYGFPVYTTTAIPTDLATKLPASDANYAAAAAAGNVFTEIYFVDFGSCMILQGNVGTANNSMVRVEDIGRIDPNCLSEYMYRAVTRHDFGLLRGGIECAIMLDVDLSALN